MRSLLQAFSSVMLNLQRVLTSRQLVLVLRAPNRQVILSEEIRPEPQKES